MQGSSICTAVTFFLTLLALSNWLTITFTNALMARSLFAFLMLFSLALPLMAQGPSRSGFPADPEDKRFQRRFPCGGSTAIDETFPSDTLPVGWATLDQDGFAPRPEIEFLTPSPGWQLVIDFKDPDSANFVMASPSWYAGGNGPSNDYLILPQLTLPSKPCLSWYAYSQDKLFGESYEIRVSTTTPDEQGFLAHPPVLTVEKEGDEFTYHSVSLEAFGEQTVYVAFRQTTNDGFILALDDIRIAQVEGRDLAMFSLDPLVGDPLDTLFFSGAVINLGLDTLEFDSLQMEISWQINNESVQTIAIEDAFVLLPNDTLQFRHDSAWVPPISATYRLRVWVSGIGVDDNIENDTLSRFQAVGSAVSIDRETLFPLRIYPNPSEDWLTIEVPASFSGTVTATVADLSGRPLRKEVISSTRHRMDLRELPKGLYLVELVDAQQKKAVGKISLQ